MKVVIIGGNRGIGLELSREYKSQGHDVVVLCRKSSKELEELKVEIVEGIDIKDDSILESLSNKIPWDQIDILIHNAGILISDHFPEVSMNVMRESFEVNTLGPLKTIMALENKLKEGSKVGIVSSRVGSISDNGSSNNYAYRVSKTAVNMVGKCLSLDLKEKGVVVALLHPGYVKTEMTGRRGLIEAGESAKGLVNRMDELTLKNSGIFIHTNGEVLPW